MVRPLLLDIPQEIATERLFLRAPRQGDGAIVCPTVRESLVELKKWMPWATDSFALENAEEWCRGSAAKFLSREELSFLILSKQGEHLGNISALRFDWAVPRCEIGYWLATAHCGRGFMTEAVAAVTKMTLDVVKCERVEIRADARNERSRRVAERAGFSLEGILRCNSRGVDGELWDTAVFSQIRRSTLE